MSKKLRMVLILVLAVIFVGSTSVVVYHNYETKKSAALHEQAEELVTAEPPVVLDPFPEDDEEALPADTRPEIAMPAQTYDDPTVTVLRNMDFSALQEENADVLGWIIIPDTEINYPLMQAEDNDYYLTRLWDRTSNKTGSIFMDYKNDPALGDYHTLIYGHRMRDGSMFAGLKYYKTKDYWESHPLVYIGTNDKCYTYEIFSAYKAPVSGHTFQTPEFPDDAAKDAFIAESLKVSVIKTGVVPTASDNVITLVTCTGTGYESRWVVQACLKEVTE